MINWKTIPEDKAKDAVRNGEFSPSVIASCGRVAVICTQDWCSQWLLLKKMIMKISDTIRDDIDIHCFIYNKSALFGEFLRFKESVWGNVHIPYIRYYHNGRLSGESNFVTAEEFFSRLTA